jgi:hypothetical protein
MPPPPKWREGLPPYVRFDEFGEAMIEFGKLLGEATSSFAELRPVREHPKPSDRILVVAGNAEQYRRWCQDHQLNTIRDAFYVRDAEQLRGVGLNRLFVLTGTYADRPDWPELSCYLRRIEANRIEYQEPASPRHPQCAARLHLVPDLPPEKPEPVDLGPEWEKFKERWSA